MSSYRNKTIQNEQLNAKLLQYINQYLGMNFQATDSLFERELSSSVLTCTPEYLHTDNSKIYPLKVHVFLQNEFFAKTENPHLSHILQVLFSIFVCKAEAGYLCMCHETHKSSKSADFINALFQTTQQEEIVQTYIQSNLEEEWLELSYKITEVWRNGPKSNRHVTIFKIQPHSTNFESILKYIDSWCRDHSEESPELTRKERRRFKKLLNNGSK